MASFRGFIWPHWQGLNMILKEKEEFERKTGLERSGATTSMSRRRNWRSFAALRVKYRRSGQHEAMSHQERKEIVRCLIDHIVVTAEKERVDATIVWKSGAETPVFVWRARSRHHLIRELYEQQLTVAEIRSV